ncbi:hypothetical protein [uncultured Duncaniella sp.]|uniref:hypothetical protein n=1 Tax=uncultured Duncaniella sp. TaxID=2768039 RepID=UPI00262D3A69|nr:hypothetical protein [uncultured Duncaniella sp.]
MKLQIQDVRKRAACRSATALDEKQASIYETSISMITQSKSPDELARYIESAVKAGASFTSIMEAFDALCECGDISIIDKMGHYIAEEAAPKVRDSSSTLTNIRRKLGRVKTKISTKINGNIQDAIGTGMGAVNAAKDNYKKNTDKIKKNVNKGLHREEAIMDEAAKKKDKNAAARDAAMKFVNSPVGKAMQANGRWWVYGPFKGVGQAGIKAGQKIAKARMKRQAATKEEAILYAYEEIEEAVSKQVHCDRILENYDKMSRRFNLDKLIVENTRINGIEDTIYQLGRWADTYAMPDMVKFNCVLECAWYGFNTNGIQYTDQQLVEYASNYFLLKEDGAKNTAKIIDTAMVVDGNGIVARDVINEDLPEEREDGEEDPMEMVNEPIDVTDALGRYMESMYRGDATYGVTPLQEKVSFQEIFQKYKQEEQKDAANPSKLKSLVAKLYSNDADDVIAGTPSFLSWIRGTLILSAFAIHPIIGVMGFIVNYFNKQDHDREDYQKMIKAFKAEKEAAEKKYKTLTDAEEKERMNAYIEELEKGIDTLNERYEALLSDDELDAKYDSENEDDDDNEATGDEDFGDLDDIDLSEFDDDADWDDEDWGDMDEAVKLVPVVANMMAVIESYMKKPLPVHLLNEGMEEFTKVAVRYPQIFDPMHMEIQMRNRMHGISHGQIQLETVSKYTGISTLDTCIRTLRTPVQTREIDGKNIFAITKQLYYPALAIKEAGIILDAQKNLAEGTLLEASFTNKLSMALDKLKKGITTLSDKEKAASRTIDATARRMSKGVEQAFTNDNREAVIKGTILPSASKTLKIALATGGVALFQPVLAVIGLLGYIGTAKKFKAKERQLVLDEIEIELKMVEKYLAIAESKNDMKATKQLLSTQRELERQHQRIKYKMKVEFGQRAPSPDEQN